MSGDVQPRKRKDKKKKKDEPVSVPPFVYKELKEEPAVVTSSNNNGGSLSSDEQIHVYKESRLGGNICAKIVFFFLLGTITVMVGLIITEYRGSSEVQSAPNSPWSQMLEGWIDDAPPDKHDDEHQALDDEHHEEDDEHDEDHGGGGHDEEDHEEEHDDEHDDEHEDEDQEEEIEASTARVTESSRQVSQEESGEQEEEEDDDNQEEEEEEEEEDDDEDTNKLSEENDQNESEEEKDDPFRFGIPGVTESVEDNDEDEDDDQSAKGNSAERDWENDNEGNSVEDKNDSEENNNNSNENDDENRNEESAEIRQGDEENESEENDDEDEKENFRLSGENDDSEPNDEPGDDADEDNDSRRVDEYEELSGEQEAAELQGVQGSREVEDEFEELTEPTSEDSDKTEPEDATESTGLALKFGVGIAIIVVAHVVLVRKWSEVDETGSTTLQATASPVPPRRQTLIPPTVQPPELQDDEGSEEYSEEEDIEDEDDEDPIKIKLMKEALIRKYGKQDSEHSEEEEEEEEEEDLPEKEFDKRYGLKYTSAPSKGDRHEDDDEEVEDEEEEVEEEEEEEEDNEGDYEHFEQRWKNMRQTPQDEQEGSDAEISGSDNEPEAIVRQPGGPKSEELPLEINTHYNEQHISSSREEAELDALEERMNEDPDSVLKVLTQLIAAKHSSTRLLLLRARALDRLAEIRHSNKFLEDSISAYKDVLQFSKVDDETFKTAAERCINRMRFRGWHGHAVGIHKDLILRFPNNPKHRNDLAVTYLMIGKVDLAKRLLKETLTTWPKNGFALVHFGFILKTSENNIAEGVRYMERGINTHEPGTMDARFLFHLGDAFNRLGNASRALEIYDLGVKEGLFRSRYQRSLYNVDRLTARPWWTSEETTYSSYFKKFEDNWLKIRNEGLAILRSKSDKQAFKDETENLRDFGDWKQLELYARGRQIASNCQRAPLTCQLIGQFPAARDCRRGQAKFSVMQPRTHVWPHCGPTNCRLRAHLGLIVPQGTELRVAEEKRSWQEGKMMVFDDSFEHEVWHNGTSYRLVLIVDVWHPELTDHERRSLPAI